MKTVLKRVKRVMWERVGITRSKETLQRALSEFDQISKAKLARNSENFLTLARLVAEAALWREESRGGHFRSDYPESSEDWKFHSIQKIDTDIGKRSKLG